MTDIQFDILGIGNAIVDVVASVDDTFLSRHDMRKGSMTLVDADAAEALYAAMPPGQESSGGSAAQYLRGGGGTGRARGVSRQGRRTTSWAACSATT